MCALVLQEMLGRGSWCMGHVVGAYPIVSTVRATGEGPSHGSLLHKAVGSPADLHKAV